jgi:hypothetical protein
METLHRVMTVFVTPDYETNIANAMVFGCWPLSQVPDLSPSEVKRCIIDRDACPDNRN